MKFHWEVEKYWETGNFDSGKEVLEYGNDKVAEQPICFDSSKKIPLRIYRVHKVKSGPFL